MPETRVLTESPAILVANTEIRPGRELFACVQDGVAAALTGRDTDRYDHAWVLLWRDGRPLGSLQVPLPLDRTDVERRVRALPANAHAVRSRPTDLPSVSVVVPSVVQRTDELERCLQSLTAVHYPAYEIVLVDNRPVRPADDPLPGLLSRYPRVRCVHEPRPGISAARNAGAAAASGDIVAFTDDDVRVDEGWLMALGSRFAEHPDEVVVTGLVVPEELETRAQRDYESHYGGFGGERSYSSATIRPVPGRRGTVAQHDAEGREVRRFAVYGIGAFGAGANMAFRRSHLERRGGFDLHLGTGTPARGGEDLAALVDALWNGGSLGYEPAAVVHHTHRRERTQLERQLHGNGVGFTAMLTSLVWHDRGHAVAIGGLLPGAALAMGRQTVARLARTGSGSARTAGAGARSGTDRRLVLLELRGMPSGPLAYLRSRRGERGAA